MKQMLTKLMFFFSLMVLAFSSFISNGQVIDTSGKYRTVEESLGYTLFGKEAPVFNSKAISGNTFDMSLMGDTVIFLNFWFIQCKGCRGEMPYLNRLQEQFKGQKFKLISLAWNSQKELMDLYVIEKKKVIINNQEIDYDVIPDCKWISEKYFVYSYPTNFVIKNGKVKELIVFDGSSDEGAEKSYANYKKEIKKIIKGD